MLRLVQWFFCCSCLHSVLQMRQQGVTWAQPGNEIIPVEADQNVAHVKENGPDHTIFTLPLVSRNTISRETMVVPVRMVASAAAVPSDIRTTS